MPRLQGQESGQIARHLDRMRLCTRERDGRPVQLATPSSGRYPLVYPRDTAGICRAWDFLGRAGFAEADEVAAVLEGSARFLLDAQADDGTWGQRYDLEANDRSLYTQEDNIAHAVTVLARHVRHERDHKGRSPFEDEALEAMTRALDAAHERLLHPDLGLFWSSTAVHESAVERGYTLWTNGAFLAAHRLAVEAAERCGRPHDLERQQARPERLEESIKRGLVHEERFIARLDAEGRPDLRPDIALLAPYYFGFADLAADAATAALHLADTELRDPDLGLPRRYLPDHDDPDLHLHAGDGPYLSMSAWLAQAYARQGDRDRAQDMLHDIASFATEDGDLPEHVSSARSFERFLVEEWCTGRDLAKELHERILRPRAGWRDVLEESVRMAEAYKAGREAGEKAGDGVVRTALPHAWTHAECAVALALLESASTGDRTL